MQGVNTPGVTSNDVFFQSHICETKPEIEWVRKLYPKFSSYTDILKEHGLLTNKVCTKRTLYAVAYLGGFCCCPDLPPPHGNNITWKFDVGLH